MQQFQVPQFIEVEDKIFGPLTVKQFVYVVAGVALVVILWVLPIPKIIFWPLAGIGGGFFGALAFFKYNGQPFVVVVNNAAAHILHTRLYIWKREDKKIERKTVITAVKNEYYAPKLTKSKLQDLSWSLDINNKIVR